MCYLCIKRREGGKRIKSLLKQQVKWSLKGQSGTNETSFLVEEFFIRKALSKIGYTFDIEELDCIEGEIFAIIAGEIASHESDEMKKINRMSRSRK